VRISMSIAQEALRARAPRLPMSDRTS